MNCPKCTGRLHQVHYGDKIKIHRCDTCMGLWCKPDAITEMKSAWMAEAVLDTGNPRIGSGLDRIDEISCPAGHGKMLKCSDPKQVHIWYEQCAVCNGVFFDAGEFTDLKYETLLDRLRSMVKGPRPQE